LEIDIIIDNRIMDIAETKNSCLFFKDIFLFKLSICIGKTFFLQAKINHAKVSIILPLPYLTAASAK